MAKAEDSTVLSGVTRSQGATAASRKAEFIKVASVADIPPGGTKAVKLDEKRSVALFNVEGRIYATNNQCPHMGYPLTRGTVRHGVVTCDWHGRRFDLEGGGSFMPGCDDLEIFPVELRNGEVWIGLQNREYTRKDKHLRLLWEGLLRSDEWTIAKAIGLLQAAGVPDAEIAQVCLRHLGRHVMTEGGPDAGRKVSSLVNGIKVARRYDGEERLIALAGAARATAGEAGQRLPIKPLPPPVTWEKIERLCRVFSRDRMVQGIERCLLTARQDEDNNGRILKLLYECVTEDHFLGFSDNLTSMADLSQIVNEFGWERSQELVCNLASKLAGRRRSEPQLFLRVAIDTMKALAPGMHAVRPKLTGSPGHDEDAVAGALAGTDVKKAFEAVGAVVNAGVPFERVIDTFVLLAADRMARTPVNVNSGWPELTTELNLSVSLRTAYKHGGAQVLANALFHTAYQFFQDRWLNIPVRSLREPLEPGTLVARDERSGIAEICGSIQALDVHTVGPQVRGYLDAGFSGEQLLHEMGRVILKDDTGQSIVPTLASIFEEWELLKGHPARNQLLVGLARYAADVRRNKNSQGFAQTALRFAEGRTTVDVFEH
jgi:nitrite reductase/ring-hydroxylating ferredoxin subunit